MAAAFVAVAYSGGRDSTALLHATLTAAAEQGIRVVALHVHHGLSENADAWLAHCERQCGLWASRRLPVAFDHRRLMGGPKRGESVEAWARRERYAALREMALAHEAPIVLLAHHRQDQAETLLLQALRGAGVAGLAAMPKCVERAGITWARPWLHVPADSVAAYVRRHRLRHIDDESNADPRFARNRLRLDVWPSLLSAFPQADAALAAAAAWAHEARQCADALAVIDLADVSGPNGLDLAAWASLTPPRRSNALRAWLKAQTGSSATAPTVQRLLAELPGRAPAHWPLAGFTLRRYRGRLECHPEVAGLDVPAPAKVQTLRVLRAGIYAPAGWGGRLVVQRVGEGGVATWRGSSLRLVERRGGEQFKQAEDRPARSLKKQFQAHTVPAWQRAGPLIYHGEQLLFVPGLGIDARAVAGTGERQWQLEWLPEQP